MLISCSVLALCLLCEDTLGRNFLILHANYLEIFPVAVIDGSQNNAHENQPTNHNVEDEEQRKPVTAVIGWHPAETMEK